MSRIDCSQTLNYAKERKRMCDSFSIQYSHKCGECPLYPIQASCVLISELIEAQIDAVQKWSDEHPVETMADKFFEIFPKAPKNSDGTPIGCPKTLGWKEKCPQELQGCNKCWELPYAEVVQG